MNIYRQGGRSVRDLAPDRSLCTSQVVEFVKVLEKDLGDRRKTSELPVGDTTGYSYLTLLDEELARKMKRVPLAYFATQVPKKLVDAEALAPSFPGWDLAVAEETAQA